MEHNELYESSNTVSNRYYDSKSSIQSSPVKVIRPVVEVNTIVENCDQGAIDICETVVQRGYDVIKV